MDCHADPLKGPSRNDKLNIVSWFRPKAYKRGAREGRGDRLFSLRALRDLRVKPSVAAYPYSWIAAVAYGSIAMTNRTTS